MVDHVPLAHDSTAAHYSQWVGNVPLARALTVVHYSQLVDYASLFLLCLLYTIHNAYSIHNGLIIFP